jgi:branched-chain amino acid transport system substrate-binding protein
MMNRFAFALALLTVTSAVVQAQDAPPPLRIGALVDMNGTTSDLGGRGSVVAIQLAVEDNGGTVLGRKIEVIAGDTLQKPDVASAIARSWYDTQGVEVIADLPNTAVAMAVQSLSRERKKITLISASASVDLYGKECSPTGFLWTYDTGVLARGSAQAIHASGGTNWYFVTANFSFAIQLENDTVAQVKALGGKLVGSVRVPQGTTDFSSALLQAQASSANVVGMALAGQDMVNAIKGAHEFGLPQSGKKIAAMVLFTTDVQSVGLDVMGGTFVTTAFYWDMDDETRAFAKRFQEKMGRPPTMVQAGDYSAVNHYLKAVKAAGTAEATAVAAKMRELPVEDFMTHGARIRPDGRVVRDMYLVQVKTRAESRGEWDLYKILRKLPGESLLPPPSETACATAR